MSPPPVYGPQPQCPACDWPWRTLSEEVDPEPEFIPTRIGRRERTITCENGHRYPLQTYTRTPVGDRVEVVA